MTTFKVNTYLSILCITVVGAIGALTIVRVVFQNPFAYAVGANPAILGLQQSAPVQP